MPIAIHLSFRHIWRWALVSLAGTLLHFVFAWSGNNPIVALIAPVNESTWEHLKLLYVPMLAAVLLEYAAGGKQTSGFLAAKAAGILVGMLTIVVLFYTYSGIVGHDILWADIATFLTGTAVAFYAGQRLLSRLPAALSTRGCGILLLLLPALAFAAFTFFPPHIGLFQDPSGTWGMRP